MPSASPYADSGLSASTTYYYQIAATNGDVQSVWSSTAGGTTQSSGGVPAAAPSAFTAAAGSDSTGPYVSFSLTPGSGGGTPDAYVIEASDCVASSGQGDGGGFRWRPAIRIPASQTTGKIYQIDAYPIGGRTLTWAFRSTAVNSSGFAGNGQAVSYGPVATVTMPVPSRPAPGAPTQVQVTAGTTIATGLYGAGSAGGTPVNISVLPADDATLHIEWNQADDSEVQFDLRYSI